MEMMKFNIQMFALSGSTQPKYFSVATAIYIKVKWTATQSQSGNYSDVTCNYYIGKTTSGNLQVGLDAILTIDGTQQFAYENLPFMLTGSNEIWVASGSKRLNHNSQGYRNFVINAYGELGSGGNTTSISETFTLNRIIPGTPDPTFIATNELFDIGPDYVKVRYVTYATATNPQIRLWQDGVPGEWRTAVGNPVLLNRRADDNYLDCGINYAVQMRFQNASGTWIECNDLWFNTLQNIYLTAYPDFTVGSNSFNISLYNPKEYRAKLYIKDKDGNVLGTRDNIYSTTYLLELTNEEVDTICSTNPNTNLASYNIDVETYNGANVKIGTTKNIGGTGIITNANPTFSNFTYQDINTDVTDLTGNNQTIVKGKSNLRAIITSANKAVALKGANMTREGYAGYRLVVGTKQSALIPYSASSTVNIDINAIDNNVFNVYAIDSRQNSTVKQISPSAFLNYEDIKIINTPTAPTIATRAGGVGQDVTLKINGTIWNDTFGSVHNSIKTCTYQYKKTTDSTYTDGTTAIVPTLSGNTFSFEGLIAGDLGASGFNIGFSYDIKITVTDELSTHSYDVQIQTAKPPMAMHHDGMAFGRPYDKTLGGPLQVGIEDSNYKVLSTNDVSDIVQWKLINTISVVGSGHALTIPATAREVLIEVFPSDLYDGSTIVIPTAVLSATSRGFDTGFYKGATDMMRILVYATNTSIWVQELVRSGNTITNIYECKVFYR